MHFSYVSLHVAALSHGGVWREPNKANNWSHQKAPQLWFRSTNRSPCGMNRVGNPALFYRRPLW